MRVLLTGANGFLGSAILARLRAEDHDVVAVTRSKTPGLSAGTNIQVDIAGATRPEHWIPHLHGIDAVVNCAGLLQDSPGQSVRTVHVDGVAALFAACEKAGVRRVIHFSAIGVDWAQPSAFSQTKLEGDRALMQRDLDWVILRPSVVVGRSAYGGSALFRGLAALPVFPVLPNTGPLQIVHLVDVVRTVLFFLSPNAPGRVALDLAGPKTYTFTEVVVAFRRWLGWREPYLLALPRSLARIAFCVGDLLGLLGWRPPIRSTAAAEMVRGATGSFEEWQRITGSRPASLDDFLSAELPSVQERWFASLYFLKALGLGIFALFWVATGLISLGPGWTIGKNLMFEGGVEEPLATLAVIGGALSDICIGVLIAFRRTARAGLFAALAISLVYAVIGTILVPRLWADPLGPMLKIWPIIAFNLMLLAVLRDR